jgi:hypothetical protein
LWDQDVEWHWPQERLIELGIRECAQIGLVTPGEVEDGTVVRMKKAYPVYDQQYHDSIATVRQYLKGFSNLQTIGRNGLHRYNNQDHSMLTGVYAVRNIMGEQYDVWSVNTEMEYHEDGRAAYVAAGDRLVPSRVEPVSAAPYMSPDEVIEAAFAKLDPLALGVAIGSVSGLGLFMATVALLIQDGPVVGPTLSLLGNYFLGFKATWSGAFIGLAEAGAVGFAVGYLWAGLKNWGMTAYVALVRRRAEAEAQRDLLDKV